jgi:glycerate dehydrogenase
MAVTTREPVLREKIVFLDRGSLQATLRRPGFAHDWIDYEATKPTEVVARLTDATIAVVNKVRLSEDVLAQLPKLKLIAVAATGTDVIDAKACADRNIAITNVRGYAVHSLPEHVFAMILALRRNLRLHQAAVDSGRWSRSEHFCVFSGSMHDLSGSTLGLLGFGALGRAVAALGLAFGMKVIAFDHYQIQDANVGRASLDEVLAKSDVLSLHLPLTPATRNVINKGKLAQMKPSAILINTARGGLVDEQALADALRAGNIAGAGIDVLSTEPPTADNPLISLKSPNLILTPHVAWASDEAMQTLADQMIDNIEAFVAGQPKNLVPLPSAP